MFGKSEEVLNYNLYPSEETADWLAQQALDRIETIDGVDCLDGYRLPPDDEEVYDPKVMHRTVTRLYNNLDGKVGYKIEEEEFESKTTNRELRGINIRSIASGRRPGIIKWGEVNIPEVEPMKSVFDRSLKVARNLVARLVS